MTLSGNGPVAEYAFADGVYIGSDAGVPQINEAFLFKLRISMLVWLEKKRGRLW